MRIAILTSSRADFGIYLPLLKAIKEDPFFNLEIIAFGTHLSKFHGYTIDEIYKQSFNVKHKIPSLLLSDDAESISTAFALTALKFSSFWNENGHNYDLVFCLGDRFEMAAAVAAGIPFNIKFAHLYGGETTRGAIDNIYRHFITLASKIYYVSTDEYARRIKELVGNNISTFVVGSLSLENLKNINLLDKEAFYNKWDINFDVHSILITIHPETVEFERNENFANEALKALLNLSELYQLIITMPNADTNGNIFRKIFSTLQEQSPHKVFLVENFGTQSYFSCMKYVDLVIGNSSSGIVEAASFEKYVINLGNRQNGRLTSGNVLHVPFDSEKIINTVKSIAGKKFLGENIYLKENASDIILQTLKNL